MFWAGTQLALTESMVALSKGLGLVLATALVACGSAPSADQKSEAVVGTGGGAASSPVIASSADGGSAEVTPPSEEELDRLLDALEQEIGRR